MSGEIILPLEISSFSEDLINYIVNEKRKKILFLHESTDCGDYMRTLHSKIVEENPNIVETSTFKFVCAKSSIIPSSADGEEKILPTIDDIIDVLEVAYDN